MPVSFSVIITTYNAEKFVSRAINSVLEQTYPAHEIIIVDDCSTDQTIELIERNFSSNPTIRIIRQPQNGGPAAARNAGIQAASADWIATLDADDAYAPIRLQRLAALIDRHPDADMVADDLTFYDDGIGQEVKRANAINGHMAPSVSLADYLQHNAADGQSTDWGLLKPCFRRAFLIEKHLLYPGNLRHGEDFAFVVSLLLAGAHFVLLDEPLYIYTQRFGALSKKSSEVTRTSVAYGGLARHAQELKKLPGIAGTPITKWLDRRSQGLMKMDDNHFFAQTVRRKDIAALVKRTLERPIFAFHALQCIGRAIRRRVG
ncbi:glycosyltransferase family 2 protein [Acetobacter sp.]|uniref:glycosyltransferase family 2 protein n=1 Tax=Acetobacter sp. TaxID=440 RepID=UPI0039E8608A